MSDTPTPDPSVEPTDLELMESALSFAMAAVDRLTTIVTTHAPDAAHERLLASVRIARWSLELHGHDLDALR